MSTDERVKAQLTPAGKFAVLLILCEVVVFAIANLVSARVSR
jgi:hypothetical protein